MACLGRLLDVTSILLFLEFGGSYYSSYANVSEVSLNIDKHSNVLEVSLIINIPTYFSMGKGENVMSNGILIHEL